MKKTVHLFAYLLIVVSFIFLAAGLYQLWLHNDPNRLAFSNYSQQERTLDAHEELPIRVTIQRLAIDVPLIPAHVTGSTWETTDVGASYLLSSPIPGKTGNSIIYAHNWASLFGNLPAIKQGDSITIAYADGSQKTFIVQDISVVSPTDTQVLQATTDKQITLYTCMGWFDSKRFVAVAHLRDNG